MAKTGRTIEPRPDDNSLSPRELDELVMCINMRICWIETGNVCFRATDHLPEGRNPNALTTDQMRLIVLLEDLRTKLES